MTSEINIRFENDEIFLPVTMQQFENLTNEILVNVNKVCDPNFLNADYLAQILMSAIHAMDHKHGLASKTALFESCINRISCHITFHAVEEIRKRLTKNEESNGDKAPSLEVVPDEADLQ
jgi:hypothetical protein